MNGVLDIAGTDYEIKDGCVIWAKGANAPINWQYRFKVRTYTYEVLGLSSSRSSSIVAVLAGGVSSWSGSGGGVYITQFGRFFLFSGSLYILTSSLRTSLPRIRDDNSGILHASNTPR